MVSHEYMNVSTYIHNIYIFTRMRSTCAHAQRERGRGSAKMASFQPVFAFLLTILLLPLLISPNYSSSNDDDLKVNNDDRVTLSLYHESFCPYSTNFIANQLGKVFETDLISIVNLRLVPWGNNQRTNNNWMCQVLSNSPPNLLHLSRICLALHTNFYV